MKFKISDIEVGDRVLHIGGYTAKWFYIRPKDLVYLEKKPSKLELIKDICKRNKHAQQDIISLKLFYEGKKEHFHFDLALANEVNSRIGSFLNNIKEKI